MSPDITQKKSCLKIHIHNKTLSLFAVLSGSVSEAGDQTMGHGTGPTMKVVCFNPGSRLKEKSQDAVLNH